MGKFFGGIAVFAAIGAVIYGYLANIVSLVTMIVADSPVTAMFIGRIVGIFVAPLGIVLGYF